MAKSITHSSEFKSQCLRPGSVAQRQSSVFIRRRSRVQVAPLPSKIRSMPSKPTVPCICKICGDPFLAYPRQVVDEKIPCCSRSCKSKNTMQKRGSQAGEQNPNWKGGISQNKIVYKKKFRARYPEKAAAHDILHAAVRRGEIKKEICSVCGCLEDVHAHHEDYGKPLDITWLCPMHHRMRHGYSC